MNTDLLSKCCQEILDDIFSEDTYEKVIRLKNIMYFPEIPPNTKNFSEEEAKIFLYEIHGAYLCIFNMHMMKYHKNMETYLETSRIIEDYLNKKYGTNSLRDISDRYGVAYAFTNESVLEMVELFSARISKHKLSSTSKQLVNELMLDQIKSTQLSIERICNPKIFGGVNILNHVFSLLKPKETIRNETRRKIGYEINDLVLLIAEVLASSVISRVDDLYLAVLTDKERFTSRASLLDETLDADDYALELYSDIPEDHQQVDAIYEYYAFYLYCFYLTAVKNDFYNDEQKKNIYGIIIEKCEEHLVDGINKKFKSQNLALASKYDSVCANRFKAFSQLPLLPSDVITCNVKNETTDQLIAKNETALDVAISNVFNAFKFGGDISSELERKILDKQLFKVNEFLDFCRDEISVIKRRIVKLNSA
jgi:hypothetical protein